MLGAPARDEAVTAKRDEVLQAIYKEAKVWRTHTIVLFKCESMHRLDV